MGMPGLENSAGSGTLWCEDSRDTESDVQFAGKKASGTLWPIWSMCFFEDLEFLDHKMLILFYTGVIKGGHG